MEPTAGLARTSLIQRYFTTPGVDPLDEVEWVRRDAWPTNQRYRNEGVLVPASWQQNDLDVTSKLYLSKADPVERKSVRRLIERVWSKIVLEAVRHGYVELGDGWPDQTLVDFIDKSNWPWWQSMMEQDTSAAALYAEGCYISVHQMAAFNSPVWFNVGRADRAQQVSACYILGIHDNTLSILQTAVRNGFIFKFGSGAGYNLSRLRSELEALSTGGMASGPLSFRRLYDALNGTFKSGGMTRRAAELVCLDDNHPDIREFIWAKPREEERLEILARAGINISMDEEGERNVAEATAHQNANLSVRLTDAFMRKVTGEDSNPVWETTARTTGQHIGPPLDARELMHEVAEAAWRCADPGVQYHDHFNDWHTTPMVDCISSPIRSTNPCGEYASNDDTSCNLASTNLRAFQYRDPERPQDGLLFNIEDYRHVVDTMVVAMDVLVELSDFPDDPERGGEGRFRHYTQRLRQLGLGYCNLGAAIMAQGIPYDSDEGRDFAAVTAALTTGRAYRKSAELAERMGPFHYWDENRESMLGVIDKHIEHLRDVSTLDDGRSGWFYAEQDWMDARDRGLVHGYRNAQASVMAPTGSISFLMGCDSTGVEPVYTIVTHKTLAGGGDMTLVVRCAEEAATSLGGYSEDNLKALADGDISCISPEDHATFHGANEISPEAHIKMCGAIQPFVSGGISKTVNMANSVTVEDIESAYLLAWELGVKNVAIYRDGSKVRQVLSSKPAEPKEVSVKVEIPDLSRVGDAEAEAEAVAAAEHQKLTLDDRIASEVDPRRRMPRTRHGLIHKIHIRAAAGREFEGYLHVGFYPSGQIGEFFLDGFGKSGSFTLNALGAWATDFSIAIQYGVPFDVLIRKAAYTSDETGGIVMPDPHGEPLVIRTCESVIDYVARYLASVSGDEDLCEELGVMTDEVKQRKMAMGVSTIEAETAAAELVVNGNGHARETMLGPECGQCGQRMFRSGACWACSCGNTTGCG